MANKKLGDLPKEVVFPGLERAYRNSGVAPNPVNNNTGIFYSSLGNATIYEARYADTELLTFRIEDYPSCCGMKIFHRFRYHYMDVEKFNKIFSEMLKKYIHPNHLEEGCERLELVMVYPNDKDYEKDWSDLDPDNLEFKFFYQFFKKNYRIQETRFLNYNSGNVLFKLVVDFK